MKRKKQKEQETTKSRLGNVAGNIMYPAGRRPKVSLFSNDGKFQKHLPSPCVSTYNAQ